MPDIQVKKVELGSDTYRQTLRLREDVLRKPLGMVLAPEELQKDHGCHHIAALQDNEVIACLVLLPLPEKTVKMRQVAVAAGLQGTGVGRKLLEETEALCRAMGFRSITLNSRETAVGFYEKLGYKKTGAPFIEVTLPHQKMEKQI